MSLKTRLSSLFTIGRGVVGGLSETTAGDDPIRLFQQWFDAAKKAGIFLPEAMSVATATPDGKPSARMMLLKGVGKDGFQFFTNYDSRKGRELDENPHVALVFHWAILQRQVRVEGTVERMSREDSNAYFQSRPRGSRIGAWASKQSSVLAGRPDLERRFHQVEAEYKGQDVPLPPFWGGFRLRPHRIEFWQGRINRLHDRLAYTRDGDAWKIERLSP